MFMDQNHRMKGFYRVYSGSCDRWVEPPRAQGSPAHEWRIPLGVGAARADIYAVWRHQEDPPAGETDAPNGQKSGNGR